MLKIKNMRKVLTKIGAIVLANSILIGNQFSVDANAMTRKEYIEENISKSNFSDITTDIISNIVANTNDEGVLSSLKLSLDGDKETDEYFLIEGIMSAAYQQEKIRYKEAYEKSKYSPYLYKEYMLDDIAVIDNLKGNIKGLPKQICLLTKSAQYGDYSFYALHNYYKSYVVVDKNNMAVASALFDYTEINDKKAALVSFADFLKNNNLQEMIKDKYSYLELFENLTFDISKIISGVCYKGKIDTSDILVIDATDSLTLSENKKQMYYILVKECPYLFIEGRDLYSDVLDDKARITIDEHHTLIYKDYEKDVYLYNEDLYYVDHGSSTDCLINFDDFMEDKGFPSMICASKRFLVNLNKIYANNDDIVLPSIKGYEGVSIVDALESNNIDSSFEYRAILAILLGMEDFKFTAQDNLKMLERICN